MYLDVESEAISVGDFVYVNGEDPDDVEGRGRVTHLNPPEGDVDDDGRSIYDPPTIQVEFRDGSFEVFSCTVEDDSGDWLFICDDLIKVATVEKQPH